MPLRAPSCLSLREVDRPGFRIIKRFSEFQPLRAERKLQSGWQSPLLKHTGELCTNACAIKVLLSHNSEQHDSISIMGPLLNTQSLHPPPPTPHQRSYLEQDVCARTYTPTSHPHRVKAPPEPAMPSCTYTCT